MLVDYFNRGRLGGRDVSESLFYACSTCLCPILMTALTTIFVLIPITVETRSGSSVFQPFPITVTGGLMTLPFATLVVIPILLTFIPVLFLYFDHENQ